MKRMDGNRYVEDLDIYVLVENATISSIKAFVAKWARGLDEPSEYSITLPDNSLLEFANIDDFLTHVLRESVHAVLYWTQITNFRSKVDAVFIFFNEDGSVIFGVGVRFEHIRRPSYVKAVPYFKELVEDLDVVAGYITVGVPADSRPVFLSVARGSEPPKVLGGIVIEC